MPETHKLMTIHAPFAPILDDTLFDKIGDAMRQKGITNWWLSPEALPDVVVMVEIPDAILRAARERQERD
jgi:hypothetical protein